MKTWTSLLTAGAILAFAAPAGNAALGNYPDYGASSSPSGKQIKNVKHVKKVEHTTIRVGNGVYGPYAYPANSRAKVAKASTAAVTRIGP